MIRHLSIDLETFSSVDIKKAGLYRYVQAPDFQILLFAYSLEGGPVQIVDMAQGEKIPEDVMTALWDPGVIKHAYNAPFEWYCLNKFILSPLEQWRCTMLHGLYSGYTAGLGATAVALGLPEDKRKMGIGKALIRTFCVPCKPTAKNGYRTRTLPHHEPEKWQLFKDYCKQDVVTEMEVENRLSAFPVPDQEQRLWELDQRINAFGVAVDQELIEGALHCSEVITAELMAEAIRLSGLDNPKSVKQLSKWLAEETGEEITDLQKSTVKDLIKTTDSDTARRMLEIRQELSKTSVKKYTAMREAVCEDSRVRGLLQFYGANRTGRWAGRLVQVQNLPRNYLETLSHARDCVKSKRVDVLKVIYGNVPDTLSQLIRTAFVPSKGHAFVVADFSAIEARVLAWLAGEQWRLDVFATHGKIYEASASQMFGVPVEKIEKGNPEYALRQKGKVAELALGYQGAKGALVTMGALTMGLIEDELPEIVKRWRGSNKRIVDLWYSIENAALDVMRTGQAVGIKGLLIARELHYETQQDFLTVTLPSGRKLFYVRPFLAQNDRGREALYYHGINQDTKKWEVVPTYGGKLVENCLAADTLVLTSRGWIPIIDVLPADLLWDGIDWVAHDGLKYSGIQQTFDLEGVRVTSDHLILTESGWVRASSCEGHYRTAVSLPNSYPLCWFERKEILMGNPMRLRKNGDNASQRVQESETEILRVYGVQAYIGEQKNSRDVQAPSVCSLAVIDRPVQTSIASGLAQLRGTGYNRLPGMGREFRGVLGGHGANLPTGAHDRENQCEWSLHPRKLQMGYLQAPGEQQAQQYPYQDTLGRDDRSRSIRHIRNRENDAALSTKKRLPFEPFVLRSGCSEPVYDLLNAGPRHRFTVLSDQGPLLVHNCVQAIARDCLAESLIQVNAAGYQTVMHVHDEIITDVPETQADLDRVCEIMGQPIAWAPGLLLKAAGFKSYYYMKD